MEGLKKSVDISEGVRKINFIFEVWFCLLRSLELFNFMSALLPLFFGVVYAFAAEPPVFTW